MFSHMQTLHLKNVVKQHELFSPTAPIAHTALMKKLYNSYLNDDPWFHFFYEPEIIIRISSAEVLEKIKTYLTKKNINFVTYAYPIPPEPTNQVRYGETPDGIVIRNLALFLPIFHAHSVAALSLNDADHLLYMERVIHTMWNPAGYSRAAEGEHLAHLASLKLGYPVARVDATEKIDQCRIA